MFLVLECTYSAMQHQWYIYVECVISHVLVVAFSVPAVKNGFTSSAAISELMMHIGVVMMFASIALRARTLKVHIGFQLR